MQLTRPSGFPKTSGTPVAQTGLNRFTRRLARWVGYRPDGIDGHRSNSQMTSKFIPCVLAIVILSLSMTSIDAVRTSASLASSLTSLPSSPTHHVLASS